MPKPLLPASPLPGRHFFSALAHRALSERARTVAAQMGRHCWLLVETSSPSASSAAPAAAAVLREPFLDLQTQLASPLRRVFSSPRP